MSDAPKKGGLFARRKKATAGAAQTVTADALQDRASAEA
jgi:hypothetical protein